MGVWYDRELMRKLIACPRCWRRWKDGAKFCPTCGFSHSTINTQRDWRLRLKAWPGVSFLWIACILIVLASLRIIFRPAEAQTPQQQSVQVPDAPAELPLPRVVISQGPPGIPAA